MAVKNVYNTRVKTKVGTLYVGSFKYTKELVNDYGKSQGLVFWFETSNEIKYVKSFILLENEVQSIITRNTHIVDDLGYILKIGYTLLDIYDFGSHSTGCEKVENDEQYAIVNVANYQYALNFSNEYYLENAGNIRGFEYAIIEALKNPFESSYLVPHDLDTTWKIETIDNM